MFELKKNKISGVLEEIKDNKEVKANKWLSMKKKVQDVKEIKV